MEGSGYVVSISFDFLSSIILPLSYRETAAVPLYHSYLCSCSCMRLLYNQYYYLGYNVPRTRVCIGLHHSCFIRAELTRNAITQCTLHTLHSKNMQPFLEYP